MEKPRSRVQSDQRQTIFFLTAALLRKFSTAIWVPILLVTVTPADFSRYGMLLSAVSLLTPLLCLGVAFAPSRLAFDYYDGVERDAMFRASLLAMLATSIIGLVVLHVSMTTLAPSDPMTQGSVVLRVTIGLHVFAAIVSEFGFSFLRVRGEAMRFASAAFAYAVVPFCLAFPFLTLTDSEPLVVISVAMSIGLLLAFAIAMKGHLKRIVCAHSSPNVLSPLYQYSVPASVHLAGLWAISASGRWIGTTNHSLDEMASYTLMSAVASVLMGFPNALLEARLPKYNSAFAAGEFRDGIKLLQRTMRFAMVALLGIYCVLATTLLLFKHWIPESYIPTPGAVILFCVFNLAHCQYMIGVRTISGLKAVSSLALSTVLSGTVSITVSYIACRHFGEVGLVAGMTIGMMLQALFVNTTASLILAKIGAASR